MGPRELFIDRVKAPCLGFAPSANPRIRGCQKCGRGEEHHKTLARIQADEVQSLAGVDPSRDLLVEQAFLTEAIKMAQRATGIYNPAYTRRVCERLDVGRERYGDGDFLGKDNLQEVLEETPDIAAYAVLELHKQRAQGLDPQRYANLYHDLLASAAYAVVADWYAQRAGIRKAGLKG